MDIAKQSKQLNFFEIIDDAWIFGEFNGHFQSSNGQITIARGLIQSAQYVDEKPFLTSNDLSQKHINDVWVNFTDEENQIENDSLKTVGLELHDIVVRNHTLKHIKIEGDDSYGHIKGLIWGKVHKPKKKKIPLFIIFLIGLILSIAALFSDKNISTRERIVSPTLPQQNDALTNKPAENDELITKILLTDDLTGDPDKDTNSETQKNQNDGSRGTCSEKVLIDSDLLFDSGRSTLKKMAYKELEKIKPLINAFNEQSLVLRVIGHSDQVGSAKKNHQLSLKRAQRIANWLTKNNGVPKNRIRIEGRGESELLTTNSDEQHLNRRVEIGFVCSNEGVPFIYTDTNLDSSKDNLDKTISTYIPNGIRIKEAINKPEVFLNSCGIPLLLSSDLLFDFDRTSLQSEAIEELNQLALIFKKAKDQKLKLKIIGHTDANGSINHNQRLSERRALKVARWLVQNKAVNKEQIIVEGLGESKLVVPIDAPADAQKYNRRVEIIVICSSENL